jgi:hypothetical protein
MLLAGFFCAMTNPSQFWQCPLGIVVGQLLYGVLFLEMGPLFVVGVIVLVVYSVLTLVGAALAWGLVKLCQ